MMRVIAYGGGVQSTALLVLAATGRIDYQTLLFANVGDDSEDPATLEYVDKHAKPYAAAHGLELHELHRTKRDGSTETLYGRLIKPGGKSIPIPAYFSGGVPGKRACSADFKVRVIGKWLKAHGASETNKATVAIGISLDEIHRANDRKVQPYEQSTYPLLFEVPEPLRRDDCMGLIRAAGLPVPPKSACWFCPYHKAHTWAEMRRDRPELFERAAELEAAVNAKRLDSPVYLTRFGQPLTEIPMAQDVLPFEDDELQCDNGVCFV